MTALCKRFGCWYRNNGTSPTTGIQPVVCRLCGKKDVRITFISHDPSRRNEKPKNITNDLIKLILEANDRCFPKKP